MCSRSTRSGPGSGDQPDEVVTREEFQAFKESMREQLEEERRKRQQGIAEERQKRRQAEARAESAWKRVEALSRKLDHAQEVIAEETGNV